MDTKEIMTKRVEFIGTMKDSLTITDSEGEEQPYFSPKFLILKYLKMSEADLELNEKYKKEEELLKKLKGGDDGKDEEDTDSENGEDEGGEEDNIDLGLDSEDEGGERLIIPYSDVNQNTINKEETSEEEPKEDKNIEEQENEQ